MAEEEPVRTEEESGTEEDSGMVDLDYEYCMARAAFALDSASNIADKQGDLKNLLRVSSAWASMAEKLLSVAEEVEEPEKKPVGFGVQNDSTTVESSTQD